MKLKKLTLKKQVLYNVICLLVLVFTNPSCYSQTTIKTAVSPEFMQALHIKYLQYVAGNMDLVLDVYPIPFARRLSALQNGDIDIMVALKTIHSNKPGIVLFPPSIEDREYFFFVHASKLQLLRKRGDENQLVLGVTIGQNPVIQRLKEQFKDVVALSTLTQKVKMLNKHRIDTFLHFRDSALNKISEMGLEKNIVIADYKSGEFESNHIAISKRSVFLSRKDEFLSVINKGVNNGDFAKIRAGYYQR